MVNSERYRKGELTKLGDCLDVGGAGVETDCLAPGGSDWTGMVPSKAGKDGGGQGRGRGRGWRTGRRRKE